MDSLYRRWASRWDKLKAAAQLHPLPNSPSDTVYTVEMETSAIHPPPAKLVSPFDPLPFEVVAHIFLLLRIDVMDIENIWYRTKPEWLLRLRLVCKRWRDVAFASPSLWNWIFLKPGVFPRLASFRKRMASSEPLPLDLYIWEEIEVEAASPFLLPYRHRWDTLYFLQEDPDYRSVPDIAEPVIPWVLSFPLPKVSRIRFGHDVASLQQTYIDAPDLKDLSACCPFGTPLPEPTCGASLESLELDHEYLETDHLGKALVTVRNSSLTLKRLSIDATHGRLYGDLDQTLSTLQYILCPNLMSLQLDSQVWPILGLLQLPSLKDLTITNNEGPIASSWKVPSALTAQSFSWDYKLCLDYMSDRSKNVSKNLFLDILAACQELKVLELGNYAGCVAKEVEMLLAVDPNGGVLYAPNLREIDLDMAPPEYIKSLLSVRRNLVKLSVWNGADETWAPIDEGMAGFSDLKRAFLALKEELKETVEFRIPHDMRDSDL